MRIGEWRGVVCEKEVPRSVFIDDRDLLARPGPTRPACLFGPPAVHYDGVHPKRSDMCNLVNKDEANRRLNQASGRDMCLCRGCTTNALEIAHLGLATSYVFQPVRLKSESLW